MNLIIEAKDFPRLSPSTQQELVEFLTGKQVPVEKALPARPRYRWRRPYDLTPDLAVRLMHGLAEEHRRRLELFARKEGRVSMKQLLKVTGDTDWHVLSHFQSVVNRKLRRLLGDEDKIAHLIGWDYDSAKWNREHTEITDGIYYVTDTTVQALRTYFEMK